MGDAPWPVRRDGLLFRRPVAADLDEVVRLRNDPRANDLMVHTHVDVDELRRAWLDGTGDGSDHSCLVERDGEVVAVGYLEVDDGPGQPGRPGSTEGLIGYVVRHDAAGQGVGTATARALLAAAFDGLGLRRVRAAAYADNAASVAILERVGMRRERYAREALWHARLGWVDEVEYALLADEWRARSAAPS